MPLFDVRPLVKFMDKLMIDTCKIERDSRAEIFDVNTGLFGSPSLTQIYHGQCSVTGMRTTRPTAVDNVQGGALELEMSIWISLPLSFTAPIIPKDLFTILTSNNPNLVGQRFITQEDAETGTYSTARRILVHRFTRVPT